MDNLTHSFVGLALSKAGLERLSPAASAVCLIAANSPDSDIVALFFGDRWTYLHHHRGITHSLVGTAALAVLVPLLFYLVDRVIAAVRKRPPAIKLKGLLIASAIASATHPFMDWTNNYGVRPFLPWDPTWHYGDLVFIIDPYIWLTVGSAVFLLTSRSWKQLGFWLLLASALTYLIMFAVPNRPGLNLHWIRVLWVIAVVGLIVLHRLELRERWGGKIALVSLTVLALYWASLGVLHQIALSHARVQALVLAQQQGESVTDLAAMPTLANPLHWQIVIETEQAAYRFDHHLGSNSNDRKLVRHPRPEAANREAVNSALQLRGPQYFLEFARFPVVRVVGEDCASQTLVQLADLRYTEPGERRGTFALEVPVECPQTQRP